MEGEDRELNTAEAYLEEAYQLEAQGKLEEALAACEAALAMEPEWAEAYNFQGVLLEDLERMELALAAYRQALMHEPKHPYARQNLQELEEELLEQEYHTLRPTVGRVMLWGALVYGVTFVSLHGIQLLIGHYLSFWWLLRTLLNFSLYTLMGFLTLCVIGKVSRYRNLLILSAAGAIGHGMGDVIETVIAFVRFQIIGESIFPIHDQLIDFRNIVSNAVVGLVLGIAVGIVQRSRKQVQYSVLAAIVGYVIYGILRELLFGMSWRWPPRDVFGSGEPRFSMVTLILLDLAVSAISGAIIGGLLGAAVAQTPVRNLRLEKSPTSLPE